MIPALMLALAAAPPGPPDAFAVVVGSNRSPAASVAPLRYGDDDAVQHARAMRLLGARVLLLTEPDGDTRDLFPGLAPDGPATRAALTRALEQAFAELAKARAAGKATRFYLFFAGHGDLTADGRPFLQLDDARLERDDLAGLVQRSSADENHVVIDACHAALFVGNRGPGGRRVPMPAGFAASRGPAWPPRTGLFTARSSGGQTHEWAELQAGVFSHEVRSGLLGGADANADGQISYRELAAFVRRANEAIANRKDRPQVITSPLGGDWDAPLVTLPPTPLALRVDRPGRLFVESERGVRVAELHVAARSRTELRLPTDLGALFLQRPGDGTEARLDPRGGAILLSSIGLSPARTRPRGAAHEAFLSLFALPFDSAAVATFQPEPDVWSAADEGQRSPRAPRWAPWAIAAAGVAVGVVGLGFELSALSLARDGREAKGIDRPTLNEQIRERNQRALVIGGAGAVLAGFGLGWAFWSASHEEER